MPFWSGKKINEELSSRNIISNEAGESIFDEQSIKYNSYRLSVGTEVAITNESSNSESKLKKLEKHGNIIIPSGQFAFILTEELLNMPKNIMGFMSIKSKIKFDGLVNVSGFHIDPGYYGRLVFASYNAGPKNISISQGDKIFQIWFADTTDTEDKYTYNNYNPRKKIDSELLSKLNGTVHSPQLLSQRIDSQHESLSKRIDAEHKELESRITTKCEKLESKITTHGRWVLGCLFVAFLGFFVGVSTDILYDYINFSSGYSSAYKEEIREENRRYIELQINNLKNIEADTSKGTKTDTSKGTKTDTSKEIKSSNNIKK